MINIFNLNSRRNNIVHVIIIFNLLLYVFISIIFKLLNFKINPNYILVANLVLTIVYFFTIKKIIFPKNVNLDKLDSTNEINLISFTNYGLLINPVRWKENARIFIDEERFYFYYNLSFLSKYFYGPYSIGFNKSDENSTYILTDFENDDNHIKFSFSNKKIYSKFIIKLKVNDIGDFRILKEIENRYLAEKNKVS